MKPTLLTDKLCETIQQSFIESFSNDNNMIVEEFDFYEQLTPKMQTELVDFLFEDIVKRFSHVFSFCEKGFRNELIIQMFSRKMRPGAGLVWPGRNFDQVHFLMQGEV